jgi:hypothetical protein
MRFTYLIVHTIIAVIIYVFFRKYKIASIAASMIFYLQFAYRICAISYNSMFALFILLLTFCLLKAYETQATKFYIGAGICFGCCCINNPLFSFSLVLYFAFCIICKYRKKSLKIFSDRSEIVQYRKRLEAVFASKKASAKRTQMNVKHKRTDAFLQNTESYDHMFSGEALLYIVSGILPIAVFALLFFFFRYTLVVNYLAVLLVFCLVR